MDRMSGRHIVGVAVVVTGLSGIVAQIVLLRELLVTYSGNELSIGVVLANWLVLEAAGAILAGRAGDRFRDVVWPYAAVALFFALLLPISLVGARTLRAVLGLGGESLGLVHVFLTSLVVLLPTSASHGALFSLGVRLRAETSGEDETEKATAIGTVYVLETAGTVLGGVLLSYLLLPHLHGLTTVGIVSLLNCGICALLWGWFGRRRAAALVAAPLCVGFVGFLAVGVGPLRRLSVRGQWPGKNVVMYENSVYGNVTVTRSEEQFTFFENGTPVITAPDPDLQSTEEFAHLPMLFHPRPRRVLVISGGAGGLLRELLKYPVEHIDYCELDPTIIEALRRFPTPLTERELSDPRVEVRHVDGRLFLQETEARYDVILIGLSLPTDLQTGRFFTADFFKGARDRLSADGILALSLPGSLTYLEENLARANLCLRETLREVFPAVRVLPGYTNYYIASPTTGTAETGASTLVARMERRGVEVRFLIPPQIRYRFLPRWSEMYESSLERVRTATATDFHPAIVFHGLSYWSALYTPALRGWLEKLTGLGPTPLLLLVAAVFAIFGLLRWASAARAARTSVGAVVLLTGFSGMVLHLVLIFSFQVIYGYVYHQIALLITAFMVGTAVGGTLMVRTLPRLRRRLGTLLGLEAGVAALGLVLPAAILLLKPAAHAGGGEFVLQSTYLLLSAACGLLVGAEFPLCNRLHLAGRGDVGGGGGGGGRGGGVRGWRRGGGVGRGDSGWRVPAAGAWIVGGVCRCYHGKSVERGNGNPVA